MSTPINALQVDTGEMPLQLRRDHLCLKYRASIQTLNNHPTLEVLDDTWHNYYNYKKKYHTFALCTNQFDFDFDIAKDFVLPIPPWHLKNPTILYDLTRSFTKKDSPEFIRSTALSFINDNLLADLHIYTDGSKTDTGTGSAFFVPEFKVFKKYTLPSHTSVYVSELNAIFKALQWIEEIGPNPVAILTDSLSSLQSIESTHGNRPDLIYDILMLLTNLYNRGIQVTLIWIPAHVGLNGNETVDQLAKEAASGNGQIIDIKPNILDVYDSINKYIINLWQEQWDTSPKGRHYYNLNPIVKTNNQFSYPNNKRNEILISKLRLGHCNLNQILFRTNRHENGFCDTCLIPETIHHFLFDCIDHVESQLSLANYLQEFDLPFTLNEVLNNPSCIPLIINIIKEAGSYSTL
jgi:ribonuclease HI